jgi:hypothetical protein
MTRTGDSRVLVKGGGAALAGVRDVAQLLQNRAVSVFSEWHFGHLMATSVPSFSVASD